MWVDELDVNIKLLHKDAVVPTYAKDGDAGLDIFSVSIKSEDAFKIVYGTGISMEIPRGFVGLVFPRSSIRKYDLDLSNCVGVVDSGYRGEIEVTFNKLEGPYTTQYKIGEKVAQMIILPFPFIRFILVNELSKSERGADGHGSTGK